MIEYVIANVAPNLSPWDALLRGIFACGHTPVGARIPADVMNHQGLKKFFRQFA
jgi:hypothetical protein